MNGSWIHGTTWDSTAKVTVDGKHASFPRVMLSYDPKGKAMLRELYQIDGFVPAADEDYDSVRQAFAIAGIQLKEALQKKRP